MRSLTFSVLILASFLFAAEMRAAEPLTIEAKIPLGKVEGRIDHFAIDLARKRLFVAELGNNSVGVIDLVERKVITRLFGFKEPQGVGYVPAADALFVANAGDGSVRVFQGAELSLSGRIELAEDADNIRVDSVAGRVYIGFGNGAIAVVDPSSRVKIGEIKLKAHPESFQLDPAGAKIWVNVPNAGEVAVLDRESGKQITAWPLKAARENFPMDFDPTTNLVFIVSRQPARIIAFNAADGSLAGQSDTCGDADDVFVDAKRRRIYVTCGEGFVDVLEAQAPGFQRLGRVRTVPGARTALFVPDLDRLFVAVRGNGDEPAAIWILRPPE
jgi:DNA-binding beta-propeller fold protein YncE